MVMDEEQEKELWLEYKKTHSTELREKFILQYYYLVKLAASQLAAKMPANVVDFEDLASYGVIGLIDAIKKFDPDKKVKFTTYASTRIRGQIFDELRNIDHVPRGVRHKSRDLSSTVQQLESQLGRRATAREIANAMKISLDNYYDLTFKLSNSTILSLDDIWYTGDDNDRVAIIDSIESPISLQPDHIVETQEVKRIIINALKELPDKEKKVLILYYYEKLTLSEIGKMLGVTESRVSQLHTRAIELLRNKMNHIRKGIR